MWFWDWKSDHNFQREHAIIQHMVRIIYPSALVVSEMLIPMVTPQFVLGFDVRLTRITDSLYLLSPIPESLQSEARIYPLLQKQWVEANVMSLPITLNS
jgi:hypothetical protein